MTNPYIKTILSTTVTLKSHQLNNDIYSNIKKNLKNQVLNKCFRHYGHIMEIYEITKYKEPLFIAGNPEALSITDVNFSCRLCSPLVNKQIICKIDRINKALMTVSNGPILVIISNDRINSKIFFSDRNNKIRYGNSVLKENDFVKITITRTLFNHEDEIIKAIGFLENIATEDEKIAFYKELNSSEMDNKQIEFNEYIKDT